jgi:hypothetical protein
LEKSMMEYVNAKIIADASEKFPGEEERVIGRDAVMNIVGRDFVIYCGGKEILREPHKHIEAYRMQSGNGLEFVCSGGMFGRKKIVRVHFVQDVKTPPWHSESR